MILFDNLNTFIFNSLLNDPYILPTIENIKKLHEMQGNLENQLCEIKDSIADMKMKINQLWDVLEVSPTVRGKFKKFTGHSQKTYDAYLSEMNRCTDERRQNVKRFIDKARQEIELWWEKTLISDTEKSRFSHFTSECYTEDLLTLHEMEIEDLKNFYNQNEYDSIKFLLKQLFIWFFFSRKIFKLFEERTAYWNRLDALQAKSNEPNRYNNRGGQLLKEEKERKTINKKLPEVENTLRAMIQEYQQRNNKLFTVYGESLEEILNRNIEERNEVKEEIKSARKKVLGASNTPFKTPNPKVNSTIKKMGSISNL